MDKTESLVLPDAKLRFENGVLERLDDDGNSTMKIEASSIRSLELHRRLSGFGAVTLTSGLTIGLIGHEFAESSTIKIFMFVLGLLVAGFGLISLLENRLVIETSNGPIKISASDSTDLIEGFIVSVRQRMGTPAL